MILQPSTELKLSCPQNIFLNQLNTKFKAYVGGYGSGKTFVGCLMLLIFLGQYPKTRVGYFGSSYLAIRDIFYPTFEEAARLMGFVIEVKTGNKEVNVYRDGFYYGTVICRSMDRPETIAGFKIACALVDELDLLAIDKAAMAWEKIVARLRLKIDGVVNPIGVTTTPEGFKFVYRQFYSEPTESYSMVQSSTYENEANIPEDYIPSLYETYSNELVKAYLYGEFVNLTAGTVFHSYKRDIHRSKESIQEKEPLFIGMDFNVDNMAAAIFVKRGKDAKERHLVAEEKKIFDTPAMIRTLKEKYSDHRIIIFPDATGKNRKSNDASESDLALLRDPSLGWEIRVNNRNPLVKDRVLATNKSFEDRLTFVNDELAPHSAKCLEQQTYNDNGEPDKKSGLDHANDAFSYPIVYENPIRKPTIHVNISGFGAR